jgi:hypothetical protein
VRPADARVGAKSPASSDSLGAGDVPSAASECRAPAEITLIKALADANSLFAKGFVAEGEGFEPPVALTPLRFQDRPGRVEKCCAGSL